MQSFGGRLEEKTWKTKNIWNGNVRIDLQEVGWWDAWTELIWLRVGTGGGRL